MKPIHFFWITFVFSLYWLLYLFNFLLMDIVIALLICVATMGIKEWIEKYVRFNIISSVLSIVVLLTIFVLPLIYVANLAANFIKELTAYNSTEIFTLFKQQLYSVISNIELFLHPYIPSVNTFFSEILVSLNNGLNNIDTAAFIQYILGVGSRIGKWSVSFANDTIFVTIFLFLFYYYGRTLYNYTLNLLPISRKESEGICFEVSGVLSVVVYSLIVSVIFQGMLFAIAVFFLDYDPVLFGMLYGFASLVPIVGGTLVWIPLCLYEIYLGNISQSIFLALYSIIVIATIADNVIKPIIIGFISRVILKSHIKINEMTIFLAIFAGLITFGFWGMILGPTITAFFVALVRLYENYFIPQNQHHSV
ncbi:AI-2E family transporter [Helicobacter monodelphidis]|uniref:AI-2E family transporter n=1 Tax=Helicobacter sp. 15-1451 TaxID=2004995 RepID=UPI000DCDDDB9|nr:AI-2E family transporter [Helicobacter sp. 15-1451]RAX58598.1 AI-2E family transporter [Helicobacter sp. 15-1451]